MLYAQQSSAGQIYNNIMILYFKWRHSTNYGKISFTPVKGIHVKIGLNECAIYVT